MANIAVTVGDPNLGPPLTASWETNGGADTVVVKVYPATSTEPTQTTSRTFLDTIAEELKPGHHPYDPD